MGWSRSERHKIFDDLRFSETTSIAEEANFPKIGDDRLITFWEKYSENKKTIQNLCSSMLGEATKDYTSECFLIVPRAIGYYLSAFPVRVNRNKILTLTFENQLNRDYAAVLINSNVFYWYWRAFGDGFATNVGVIARFPVPNISERLITSAANRLFANMESCVTYQNKWGDRIPNYNFNKKMDILLEIDDLIMKQVAPQLNLPYDIFAQYKSNSFLHPFNMSELVTAEEPEGDE